MCEDCFGFVSEILKNAALGEIGNSRQRVPCPQNPGSRNGRHGHVYTNSGKLNLFNQKYELDPRPIEEGCQCPACRHYSRAYIRHLLKAKEMLGMRLCVLHNLYFYNNMMEEIRTALEESRFAEYKRAKLDGMMESSGR